MATRPMLSILLAGISIVAAAAEKPGAPSAPTAKAYDYWDGDRPATVWLSADVIAEFDAGTQSAPAGTRDSRRYGEAVQLWQLQNGKDLETVLGNARAVSPARRFSPVFQEDREGSRIRALPGGVIVELDARIDTLAEARQWADRRGVSIAKKHPVGTSTWELAGEPGLASLELANSLAGTGGVVSASPVWWMELVTK